MKKVIIIGGGIVGLSSAYFLQEAGHEVILLEKGKMTDGASYGNAGYICPSHVIPLAQPGMISKGIRWMFNSESPFYIKPKLDLDLMSWGWKFYRAATHQHVDNAATVLRDMAWMSKSLYQDFSKKEGFDFAFEEKGLVDLFRTKKGEVSLKTESEIANKIGVKVEYLSAEETQALDPHLKMDILGSVYYCLLYTSPSPRDRG